MPVDRPGGQCGCPRQIMQRGRQGWGPDPEVSSQRRPSKVTVLTSFFFSFWQFLLVFKRNFVHQVLPISTPFWNYPQIYLFPTHHPTLCPFYFSLSHPPNPGHTAHIFMDVWPSTRAWLTRQWQLSENTDSPSSSGYWLSTALQLEAGFTSPW